MKLIERLRPRRTERGAALMLIALSLTATIATAGVIVDGGNAFSQRRQMQNSADSAALAGARALDYLAVNGESAIWNAVLARATSNGADSALVTCRLVTDVLVDIGACPPTNTGTAVALRTAASGVRVTVATTGDTSFIRAVGVQHFTARAVATGQIEALTSGASPFVLCATGNTDIRSIGSGQTIPILNTDNSINPAAIGVTYLLQDSNVPGCGQGNTFKGLALNFNTNPVPGPWDLFNGNHGSNVSGTVVAGNNACRGTFTTGCVVMVPLCHGDTRVSSSGVAYVLYCERFGAFQITDIQGQSRIGGIFVDHVEAASGQGGGHAQSGEVRVIKLSE